MPLTLDNHRSLVVSASQLGEMASCPRRWFYRYVMGRVKAAPSPALIAGKAFDNALNLRYRQVGSGSVTPALAEAMAAEIDAGFAGTEFPLTEHRTPARFKDVVRLYNEQYQHEDWRTVAVQLPFAVKLGEVAVPEGFWLRYLRSVNVAPQRELLEHPPVPIILHGILDLLVAIGTSNVSHLIVDTKTSKDWTSWDELDYENHPQMKGYAWAVPEIKRQALERGENDPRLVSLPDRVEGCMVNAVIVRPDYANPERKARYNDRPRTEFRRHVFHYTQERLAEWRDDTLWRCGEALRWFASGHYPQSEKTCHRYFGGSCEYWDVCSRPKEQRASILASDIYMPYERGPLGGVGEEKKV